MLIALLTQVLKRLAKARASAFYLRLQRIFLFHSLFPGMDLHLEGVFRFLSEPIARGDSMVGFSGVQSSRGKSNCWK